VSSLFQETLGRISPPDTLWSVRAAAHQQHLTKPPHSLGRLEEIANRVVAIQQTLTPHIDPGRIVVFAADHGVTEEGISPYPREVTAQMVRNFISGGAAINALCRAANLSLHVVDVGVAGEVTRAAQLKVLKIRAGTRNFLREPAMTGEEAVQAIEAGITVALEAADHGIRMAGFGEMGIGNSTSAAALTCALTGLAPDQAVGRGSGAPDAMFQRKREVVEGALKLHGARLHRPLDALACVGGLEVAAMAGFCLGAASRKLVVVVDGFIASAAALLAVRLKEECAGYLFPSHLSVEPGHQALLTALKHQPLLDLRMRLGEGTGAALAIGLIRGAVATFRDMATFESAGVSTTRNA
jgi:nicotinate-nucleotide--dimethylbenzimidazole phosphoribosyltransferase